MGQSSDEFSRVEKSRWNPYSGRDENYMIKPEFIRRYKKHGPQV
jgi:hypothetical protein